MKKVLLLCNLFFFTFTPSVHSADYSEIRNKCILDNILEVDNDRASKIVKRACEEVANINTGSYEPYAEKFWKAVNRNKNKNSEAA